MKTMMSNEGNHHTTETGIPVNPEIANACDAVRRLMRRYPTTQMLLHGGELIDALLDMDNLVREIESGTPSVQGDSGKTV